MVQGGASVSGHDAGHVREVLECHRHAMKERKGICAGISGGAHIKIISGGSITHCLIGRHRDESTQALVPCLYPAKVMFSCFPGGQFAHGEGIPQLHSGEFMEVSHDGPSL
jgi:hypothetical protein